jgi:hypothetical protein
MKRQTVNCDGILYSALRNSGVVFDLVELSGK